MNVFDLICCPVCGGSLHREGQSLMCLGEGRRHCFDIASSGYVNLLPPGKGKNSHTGDDKFMISARAEFLGKGYYSRMSERLGQIIASLAKESGKTHISLVDAGCGEGYHTCNIVNTIVENGIGATAIGFDASKHGAAAASKRAKREGLFNTWNESSENTAFVENSYDKFLPDNENVKDGSACFAAGNIFTLPINSASADFVVSMFAPVAGEENFRILKDDGYLAVAAAGENHLYELRKVLYDDPRGSSGEVVTPEGFELVSKETFAYKTTVQSENDIKCLFSMTPFYYRTSREDKAKLDGLENLEITVETVFFVYRKLSER